MATVKKLQNAGTNAARFVNAYNMIDHSLRTQYNFKNTLAFSDLIRRCSSLNMVIRNYEDDLIDLARLRNAIIHSRSEQLIAEPHDDVVEIMEKIAKLVSTPPLAIAAIKSTKVDIVPSTFTLRQLIAETSRVRHSSLPVYRGENLIGVVSWRKFIDVLGSEVIPNNLSLDQFVNSTTIEAFFRQFPKNAHFAVVSVKISIEEVLKLFNQNRKLSCVILTQNGTAAEMPAGIITNSDLLDLMSVLETF